MSAASRSRGYRRRDVDPAAEEVRGDALVVAAAGLAPEDRERDGRQGVAGVRGPAVEVGDVHVLHRPRTGRQGHDVVVLSLAPPENAVVLCVDEKSQIQALDRTAPMLPMRVGGADKRTHDDKRHGTTTLFAALEIATGHVTGAVKPKHRRQEFLAFLRQIDRAYPETELHLVMDNYATHKTPEVKSWLETHPRFHVHVTPTSPSIAHAQCVWRTRIRGEGCSRAERVDRVAVRRGWHPA